MQDTDKQAFAVLICGVAEYYGKTLSKPVISLYWAGLKQYDLVAVEKALWDHTQNPDNGQFMPKIADVSRFLQGRTQDQASLAWSKVDNGVRVVGTYRDVVFDDGLIHRVLSDMGGWVKLGTKTEDEWPFVAKEFENRYRGYKMRSETPEYPKVMTGIANTQNESEGQPRQDPILIGDHKKAQNIMLSGTSSPIISMIEASKFNEPTTRLLS